MTTGKEIADALRSLAPDQKLLSEDVALIDKMAALWGSRKSSDGATLVENHKVTARTAAELASHEAIVREAYKDSVGFSAWAVSVTNVSGHQDHPPPPYAPDHQLNAHEKALQ